MGLWVELAYGDGAFQRFLEPLRSYSRAPVSPSYRPLTDKDSVIAMGSKGEEPLDSKGLKPPGFKEDTGGAMGADRVDLSSYFGAAVDEPDVPSVRTTEMEDCEKQGLTSGQIGILNWVIHTTRVPPPENEYVKYMIDPATAT